MVKPWKHLSNKGFQNFSSYIILKEQITFVLNFRGKFHEGHQIKLNIDDWKSSEKIKHDHKYTTLHVSFTVIYN